MAENISINNVSGENTTMTFNAVCVLLTTAHHRHACNLLSIHIATPHIAYINIFPIFIFFSSITHLISPNFFSFPVLSAVKLNISRK